MRASVQLACSQIPRLCYESSQPGHFCRNKDAANGNRSMGWRKKKADDPISERARALNAEIAALEAQIASLDAKLGAAPPPKLRSTARPGGAVTAAHLSPAPAPPPSAPAPKLTEPIFEDVDQARLQANKDDTLPKDEIRKHYNDLGVRKYDLAAFWERVKNQFRGPSTSNRKLVNYLAAGSIQGLRPMRYEKRVARNRFLAITIFILAILIGAGLYLWGRR